MVLIILNFFYQGSHNCLNLILFYIKFFGSLLGKQSLFKFQSPSIFESKELFSQSLSIG